jgi:alkyl sulfatase BDS1-like metallo-beta-lactamase superfamily hydrolase
MMLAEKPIEEMAPGLYLIAGFGNVGVVVTDEGVALVDTGMTFDREAALRPLRTLSDTPVRYIIYTHGHADHAANAGPILEEAARRGDPRPTIVAHANVPRRMDRYAELYEHNARINRLQFRVPPGSVSFPPDARFIRPDVTYHDSTTLRLGDLTLHLFHALGETDDITWIHIPERRAIFSGDLVIRSCPNIGNPLKPQRFEVEWAEALERMRALQPEVLGPGHGAVLRGGALDDELRTTAQALRYLHDEVVRRLNAGQGEVQIVREVRLPDDLARHPALAPVYGSPRFIVQATVRRYTGWYDGNPSHLAPAPTAEIAAEVVALAGAEALLARAEALARDGSHQLALHLLDFALDGGQDAALRRRALQLKGASLARLAEAETSFIARSILTNAAERAAEEAAAQEQTKE